MPEYVSRLICLQATGAKGPKYACAISVHYEAQTFSKKPFECSLQKEKALPEGCSTVFYAVSAPISHNNHPQKHKLKFCKSSAYLVLAPITVTASNTLGKGNVIVQK